MSSVGGVKVLNLLVLITPLTFLWAAIHGFHGAFCVHSYAQKTCGNNPVISYATLGWVSVVVFVVSVALIVAVARRDR